MLLPFARIAVALAIAPLAVIALGLKNGQWTAAAIVVVSLPMLLARFRRVRPVA